jgi:hypothetical protein
VRTFYSLYLPLCQHFFCHVSLLMYNYYTFHILSYLMNGNACPKPKNCSCPCQCKYLQYRNLEKCDKTGIKISAPWNIAVGVRAIKFNAKTSTFFPTEFVYVVWVNRDFFSPKQHSLICVCNRSSVCSLWGKNLICIYLDNRGLTKVIILLLRVLVFVPYLLHRLLN